MQQRLQRRAVQRCPGKSCRPTSRSRRGWQQARSDPKREDLRQRRLSENRVCGQRRRAEPKHGTNAKTKAWARTAKSWAAKVCENPVQSWGLGTMNTRQRAAASRETAAKRQPGTHGFRARLLRREVRRWHASCKRGSTFCPLDGVCRCWWASQAGVGAALCFLGGRCRRCGLQGPASELVGVAAADAAVRVTPAPLGEVAQRRSSPRCDEVCVAEH